MKILLHTETHKGPEKHFCIFTNSRGTTFLLRKGLGSAEFCSAFLSWRQNRSNMEKSSYCCSSSLGRFNTGERHFHLSAPHSSPDTEHHLSEQKSNPRSSARKNVYNSGGICFRTRRLWDPGDRWLQNSFTLQSQCAALRGIPGILNVFLGLFDTEVPKCNAARGNCGRRGRPAAQSNSPDSSHVEEEERCNGATSGIHLTSIRSSLFTSTWASQRKTAGEATSVSPSTAPLYCNAVCDNSKKHHNHAP